MMVAVKRRVCVTRGQRWDPLYNRVRMVFNMKCHFYLDQRDADICRYEYGRLGLGFSQSAKADIRYLMRTD